MAPNGTGIDKPSEWRGGGDAGWRVEMFAKDEQIRVLTARLAAAEDLLREDLQGTGHTPSWWSRLSKALQHQEVKGGEMRDTDREQIERGIASIGYFDVENCTCDASVGFYPCHYCAEREAILAGRRVLERLAAAEAALKPFAEVARGIPDNWPGECHLRIDGEPVQLGDFIGCREWLCYHGVQDVQDACLPTIEQWREAAKAGGSDGRRM